MKLLIFSSAKSRNTSRASPGKRTPTKKASKIQPLLDPSRLKPPSNVTSETRNSQLNLTIGLQRQQFEDENEILSIHNTHGSDIPKIEML